MPAPSVDRPPPRVPSGVHARGRARRHIGIGLPGSRGRRYRACPGRRYRLGGGCDSSCRGPPVRRRRPAAQRGVAHVTPPGARSGLHSSRMPAYTRAMSTTETRRLAAAAAAADDRLDETAVIPPVPVRRSVLRPAQVPARAGLTPFDDWRGRAPTEELAAVPAPCRRSRRARRSACRRGVARRHLRCALVGTLLAVVAVSGPSAYAAAGVTDARSTAPCQAHPSCR